MPQGPLDGAVHVFSIVSYTNRIEGALQSLLVLEKYLTYRFPMSTSIPFLTRNRESIIVAPTARVISEPTAENFDEAEYSHNVYQSFNRDKELAKVREKMQRLLAIPREEYNEGLLDAIKCEMEEYVQMILESEELRFHGAIDLRGLFVKEALVCVSDALEFWDGDVTTIIVGKDGENADHSRKVGAAVMEYLAGNPLLKENVCKYESIENGNRIVVLRPLRKVNHEDPEDLFVPITTFSRLCSRCASKI